MLVATGAVAGAYGAVAETAAGRAAVRALQGAVTEVVGGVLSEKQGKEIALNALLSAAYGAADPLETDSAVLKGAFDSFFKTLIKGAANKLAFDKEFDLRTLPVSAATGAAGAVLGSASTVGNAVNFGTQKGTLNEAAKALLRLFAGARHYRMTGVELSRRLAENRRQAP